MYRYLTLTKMLIVEEFYARMVLFWCEVKWIALPLNFTTHTLPCARKGDLDTALLVREF
jgi:hypothetical protein